MKIGILLFLPYSEETKAQTGRVTFSVISETVSVKNGIWVSDHLINHVALLLTTK